MVKPYAAYLSSLLLFGSNGLLAAMIALPSLDIVVARTFLGAVFLGVAFAIASRAMRHADKRSEAIKAPHDPQSRSFRRDAASIALLICSGAALGVSWIVLFEAYRLIGVGTASLLYYCGPVIVMATAPLLFKERLGLKKAIGFAAVAIGALLVSIQTLDGGHDPRGLTLGVAAAIAYSVMIICSKKASALNPNVADAGLRNSFIQLLGSFVVAVSYRALTADPTASVALPSPTDIAPLLMLGLANTGIGCFLYFSSIGRLPVQTVAVCGYLEPLSAVVLATLVLGEPMSAAQLMGAALIIGGAAFCELTGRSADRNTSGTLLPIAASTRAIRRNLDPTSH